MKIPVLDLGPEIEELWPEINEAFERVVRSAHFILGPEVRAFEEEAADMEGRLADYRMIGYGNNFLTVRLS